VKNAPLRLLAIALLVALPASLLTACDPPPPTRLFGTHDDLTYDVDNSRISSTYDYEDAFDIRISRNTLRWNTVQTGPNTYDWAKTDWVVKQATDRGIKIQFMVRDAPQWATGSADPKIVPSNQTAFNTFATRYKNFFVKAVQRYGDRVKNWEVWSEPNEYYYWQPQGLTPNGNTARWIDLYAQLFKTTAPAVASANSSVKVAVGAVTGIGASCCILGTEFVKGLIDRGVNFKYLALNPHSGENQAPWQCIQFKQSFCDIQKIRDVLVSKGKSSVGMWVSEFGWQVGAFTRTGTTLRKLRIPGNQNRLNLWPASGEVLVQGKKVNYTSITRTADYSDINLARLLTSLPPVGTPIASPQAEATQATYVRAALQMMKGTYTPASGRPQQNYSYLQVGIYYRDFDKTSTNFGMYGLFHAPTPTFQQAQPWFLQAKPAAGAFKDESP
jgi:hypothetical protein